MIQERPPADLGQCSKEPIHIPGAIQPHGGLLVLDRTNCLIEQASVNAAEILGCNDDGLIGWRVDALFPRQLLDCVPDAEGRESVTTFSVQIDGRLFDATAHRVGASLIVELEKVETTIDLVRLYRELQKAIARVQGAPTLQAIYQEAADSIAILSGFDRVMIYQFDEQWNGSVVAEKLSGPVESYLGQHFPATDIPVQARELYRRNWLRLIPNSTYEPVAIVGERSIGAGPLDMSHSVLRSVSPVHLEYLRNMNVGASMSVSILRGDQLWGLIACHHEEPRHLPSQARAACELLGQVVSTEIASRDEKVRLAAKLDAQRIQTEFFDYLAQEENVLDALTRYTPRLLELVAASGAAICLNGRTVLFESTPSEPQVEALIEWLKERRKAEPIFHTDGLSMLYPPAKAYEKKYSGLLAISLSREGGNFILWFRPEVPTTIDWAGNPDKSAMFDGKRIHPRRSFEIWRQQVNGKSLPWREVDKQAAVELRNAINALILRRADRLIRMNAELERKNVDLNSFAYIASHDLQEPLRGLREISGFLIEDYGDRLDADGTQKLHALSSLAQHMHDLIESLQRFSRVGRMEIDRGEVDLGKVVEEARRAAATRLEGVEVDVVGSLPTVQGDRVLLKEVMVNLLTNAVKYSNRPDKRIEIGVEPPASGESARIYVRDNGIGIREKHLQEIFKIFRRLHPRERYGGGTGVGLAICKAIIERHGGSIWCESVFGEGTTFRFTLGS